MPEKKTPNPEATDTSAKWYQKSPTQLFKEFQEFLGDLIDINVGTDQRGSMRNIMNNKEMKGANAWLLMCSIMVASLGLDLNSPAVIIGAMLISPLMSPILGIGLGVAVNDRQTLSVSLQHFASSILIALITSFIYFKLTPLRQVTPEILARTQPNLLDGLVAIFGGLAGIISMTRKDKSNAVPGVAIATALMPPLCVAGFGLAEGRLDFFTNAFYLFFLNSSFIAISTYMVIRILGFKYKEYPNVKERNRNIRFMVVFAILILSPAIYWLYTAWNKQQEENKIEQIIKRHFEKDFTAIADWQTTRTDSLLQLDIQLIGEPIEQELINVCDSILEQELGKNILIIPYQSEEIPFDDIQKLKREIGGFQGEVANKIANLEKIQQEREKRIEQLMNENDSLKNTVLITNIFDETQSLFPDIEEIGFTRALEKTNFSEQLELPTLFVRWKGTAKKRERNKNELRLKGFVQKRANLDTLLLITY